MIFIFSIIINYSNLILLFFLTGIPATLTYIDLEKTPGGSPALIPYPSLANNVAGDCENGLSTVYRIKADKCGRLWVLDTGTVGIGNTTENLCPYAMNVFDLATNTRIRRYEFRPEDTNPNTFIANIAVDIGKSCEDTYAYVSDELGYGLITYSWELNKTWRFAHSFFFPDPLRGDFNVAGLNFQWGEEGIFGMALSPIKSDGFRTMYFSPLASHRQFSVSTKILRDETRVEDSFHDFQVLSERASNAHTTSRVMSDDGLELFNLIDQNSVGCWHSTLPYDPKYHGIVDRDDMTLVFPADIKIDENNRVWVISDRMPVFLIADLDYNDVNFRIFSAPLDYLVQGTVCDVRDRVGIFNRFAEQPQTIVDLDLSQKLTSIFPETTVKYSSNALPSSHIYTTQEISSTPKAFVFNQHNGVQYEAHSPQYYHNRGSGSGQFHGHQHSRISNKADDKYVKNVWQPRNYWEEY
jgi:hypothetical protein